MTAFTTSFKTRLGINTGSPGLNAKDCDVVAAPITPENVSWKAGAVKVDEAINWLRLVENPIR